MDAWSTIAALDDALAADGIDVVLRRQLGKVPTVTNYDVTVRARLDSSGTQEIVGGVAATVSTLIISPTQIAAANWPNDGESGPPDPALPRRNDKVVVAGRTRVVEMVDPKYVAGALVRIELKVSG